MSPCLDLTTMDENQNHIQKCLDHIIDEHKVWVTDETGMTIFHI